MPIFSDLFSFAQLIGPSNRFRFISMRVQQRVQRSKYNASRTHHHERNTSWMVSDIGLTFGYLISWGVQRSDRAWDDPAPYLIYSPYRDVGRVDFFFFLGGRCCAGSLMKQCLAHTSPMRTWSLKCMRNLSRSKVERQFGCWILASVFIPFVFPFNYYQHIHIFQISDGTSIIRQVLKNHVMCLKGWIVI